MQGKTRLPSLRAVEIFVVAGRMLSFAAAAHAIKLTPSAVSRRIRDLERELGTPLFHRFNRRVELTSSGARFLDAAGCAIDLIERECAALRQRRNSGTLRMSVLQSLASTWLLPRLANFRKRRPDLDVQIETSAELADLVNGPFDAAVRFGDGRWPGLSATRLFETRGFAVAAPTHWPCGAMASPAALDSTTLLAIAQMPDLWTQYLAGLGMGAYRPRRVETFDNVQVMLEAAANGLGLALTVRELVEGPLAAGRLAPAFSNPPVSLRQAYYLVYRKDRREEPALRALRDDLVGCAEII